MSLPKPKVLPIDVGLRLSLQDQFNTTKLSCVIKKSMDDAGNSGDDPLSPRNAYTRQHSGHRHERRHSDAERVLTAQHQHQHQHQQSGRTLTVPAQLAAAFPTWTREAADTLFGLLERGENAQAAAISEAFSGANFPGLSAAGRSGLSPQGGQHQASHSLQHASALQHLQQQHLQQGLHRRNGDQTTSNESFVPPGTDTHSLLAQYQLQAQQLAAAPR